MRMLLPIATIVLACGCASTEYRDTNAAVDANPLCASRPDRPGEPVPAECERKTETVWSGARKDATPLDFSGKPRDD